MDSVKVLSTRSGDVDLRIQVEGAAEGPTLVLLHGYPDDLSVWDSLVEVLAPSFRIIRYDVRGCGESSAPSKRSEYRMEHLVNDLRAVILATKNDQPVHLVAHDWGSIQAWEAVSDPFLAPIFASFTSISGPSLDYIGAQSKSDLQSREPERLKAFLQQLSRSWYVAMFQLPVLPERAWSKNRALRTEAALARRERIPQEYFATPWRAKNGKNGIQLYRANMIGRLMRPNPRATNVPVQVIIPKHDAYVGEGIARSCEEWANDVSFELVDGGHWFFVREPGLLSRHIRNFVTGVERTSTR